MKVGILGSSEKPEPVECVYKKKLRKLGKSTILTKGWQAEDPGKSYSWSPKVDRIPSPFRG